MLASSMQSLLLAALVARIAPTVVPEIDPATAPHDWISWSAPAPCPREGDVEARVEALGTAAPRVRARGVVVQHGTQYELRLTLESESGRSSWVLRSTDCRELGSATALLIAVAADPLAVSARITNRGADAAGGPVTAGVGSATARGPVDAIEPTVEVPTADDPAASSVGDNIRRVEPERTSLPSVARGPASETRLFARAAALVGAGVTPSPATGFRLGLGVLKGRFRGELLGTYRIPRRSTTSGRGVRIQTGTGAVRACARLGPLQRWEVPLCAGLELGVTYGRGYGWREDGDSTGLLAVPHVAVGGAIRLAQPLFLRVGGMFGVVLPRRGYAVAGVGRVWQASPVIGEFDLGSRSDSRAARGGKPAAKPGNSGDRR